jgi:hemerythrin
MGTTTEKAGHGSFVVEWREGFKVGIATVDAEHRHLFSLVKRLDSASAQETLDELLEYVVTHFTNEQALMESSGYPDFRLHLTLHEQLGAQVAEFLGASDGWTEERVQELRKFLNKWLVGHILTHDLRFGRWYLDHAKQHPVRQPQAAPAQAPVRRGSWLDRLLGRG